MLSSILSRETCADCRFCCSFRRKSLWETPCFADEKIDELMSRDESVYKVSPKFESNRMKLDDCYKTDDSEEEVACFYLDRDKGCILSADDKPFDCSIWPLRVMKKKDSERLLITLTPTCPAIGPVVSEELEQLVKSGLGDRIFSEAKKFPLMIKEYREGFPIIMETEE